MLRKVQTPLTRFVVDLLYNKQQVVQQVVQLVVDLLWICRTACCSTQQVHDKSNKWSLVLTAVPSVVVVVVVVVVAAAGGGAAKC